MKNLKLAIIECYPDRAKAIEKLFRKVDPNLRLDVYSIFEEKFPSLGYDGYIISGGVIRVVEKKLYPYIDKMEEIIRELVNLGKPILGICLGLQMIADACGGEVAEAEDIEVGIKEIKQIIPSALCEGISEKFVAFNYHWDFVKSIPQEFQIIAKSDICETHIIEHKSKPIFGIQFHIEYDESDIPVILDYLKEEIFEEGLNYGKILEDVKLYNPDVSFNLTKNFIEIVRKQRRN